MEKRKAISCDLLPREIWSGILIRLPIKSILRCRSVCKSWYSLISNPKFISDYEPRNLTNRVLLQRSSRCKELSFSSYDEKVVECHEHIDECSELYCACDLHVIGSCNGLICLYKINSFDRCEEHSRVTLLIWNPSIRKIVQLPPLNLDVIPFRSFHGFGFDQKTCDYKILWVESKRGDDGSHASEVFDLRKGVWRRINLINVPSSLDVDSSSECYLNGAVHWIHRSEGNVSLLSFDLSDEVLRETKMPFKDRISGTAALGGLIHVVVWKKNPYDHTIDDCSVWAMKEYGVSESWTKVFNIDLEIAQRMYHPYKPIQLYLLRNGEILLLDKEKVNSRGSCRKMKTQRHVLYNIESRKSKCVFTLSTKFAFFGCLYKESLMLI